MSILLLCLLVSVSLCGCGAPQVQHRDAYGLESVADHEEDLRFWMEIPDGKVVVSSRVTIRLHVAKRQQAGHESASLLAGRLVFTFVSVGPRRGARVHAVQRGFSGGGGIDYSGEKPLEFVVVAPPDPGRYRVYVTVQSTAQDVRNFLRMAKVSASAGPWWIGNRSTRPLPLEIVPAH